MGKLERLLLDTPLIGRWYAGHAAWLKRRTCLALAPSGLLKPFTFVQWLATSACNFRCPFCEASAGEAGGDELTTAEARAFIEDVAAMGVRNLVVSGGEPLVRPDLPDLLELAAERGLRLGLVTNASLLPRLWDRLRDLPLYLLFTSLDGPEDFHDQQRAPGSYRRVLEALELAAASGVGIRMVNTVVQPANIERIRELRPVLEDAGATHWRLTPAAAVGRARARGGFLLDRDGLRRVVELAHTLRDRLDVDLGESHTYLGCLTGSVPGKPFFCGAGLTRCSIMPDGSVLGCHEAYDTRLAEGNVRETPLSVLWRREFRRFRSRAVRDQCAGCPHLDMRVRLPDFVVHTLDRSSMAAAVEARVPFLDHEVVELAARIPPGVKMRGLVEKHVLRAAVRGLLPEPVRRRRKRGMDTPVDAWFRGPLPPAVEELLCPGALAESGIFDPAAVAALLDRHRRRLVPAGRILCGVAGVQAVLRGWAEAAP